MFEHLKAQDPHHIWEEIFVDNTYGVVPEEIEGKVVFDLGANKGFFTILCNEYKAKEIIAVEPNVRLFCGLLEQNTKDLHNVMILNYAVTDTSESIVFLSDNDQSSSLYSDIKDTFPVRTITLKNLVGLRPDTDMVLKMDIEGAEYDVLMNANKELMDKFKTIYIEIHGKMHPRYKGPDILEKKLVSFGFVRAHFLDMCTIYSNPDGTKTYVPLGYRTCKYVRG
jgi:FkbM family methyltransferase